jgi:alpha-glucosidase
VEGGVYCFHKKRRCNGYQVTGAAFDNNKIHLAVSLSDPSGCGHYGSDIRNLKVTISFETDAQLHIKLADEDHERYEIPSRFVPTGDQFEEWLSVNPIANSKFKFSYRTNPFTFSVKRKDNNETIFDTNVAGMDALVYEQQYLEISTVIPMHSRIYGLGEVVHRTLERDKRNTWQTLWARDAASPVDENGK